MSPVAPGFRPQSAVCPGWLPSGRCSARPSITGRSLTGPAVQFAAGAELLGVKEKRLCHAGCPPHTPAHRAQLLLDVTVGQIFEHEWHRQSSAASPSEAPTGLRSPATERGMGAVSAASRLPRSGVDSAR